MKFSQFNVRNNFMSFNYDAVNDTDNDVDKYISVLIRMEVL